MPRTSPFLIHLSSAEEAELHRRAGKYTLPYFQVQRAKMILLAAEGLTNDEIAARLDSRREVVGRWRTLVLRGRDRAAPSFWSTPTPQLVCLKPPCYPARTNHDVRQDRLRVPRGLSQWKGQFSIDSSALGLAGHRPRRWRSRGGPLSSGPANVRY